MASKKYSHYIKKLKYEKNSGKVKGSGSADYLAWPKGKDMEGINLNFTWAFHTGLGAWYGGKDPHTHPRDEALFFVGLDPERPDCLGAEI